MKNWKRILIVLLAVLALAGCGKKTKEEKALREEGIALLDAGDYAGASEKFNAALALDTDQKAGNLEIDILRYRAEAEMKASDFSAAEKTYKQLLADDGSRPEYLDLRTVCLVRAGNPLSDALAVYNEAEGMKEKAATHEEAMYCLGNALSESGKAENVKAALELYQNALNDETRKNAEIYNRIGLIYYGEQDYKNALDWFTQGVAFVEQKQTGTAATTKTDAILLYNEASCYEYLQQYDKALELFQAYLTKYGADENVQHEITFLKSRTGS